MALEQRLCPWNQTEQLFNINTYLGRKCESAAGGADVDGRQTSQGHFQPFGKNLQEQGTLFRSCLLGGLGF